MLNLVLVHHTVRAPSEFPSLGPKNTFPYNNSQWDVFCFLIWFLVSTHIVSRVKGAEELIQIIDYFLLVTRSRP